MTSPDNSASDARGKCQRCGSGDFMMICEGCWNGSDRRLPAATDDEDHPDCHTKRERELYFALMGLTSAVMTRRREWENWEQGGVIIAPIVRKALRLDASMQEDGK